MPDCKRCGRTMPAGELRRTPGGNPVCKDKDACTHATRMAQQPAELEEQLDLLVRRAKQAWTWVDQGDVLRALSACRMLNETLAEVSMLLLTWGVHNGLTQKAMAIQLDVPPSTLTGLKRTA